jgi:hypothetical protein
MKNFNLYLTIVAFALTSCEKNEVAKKEISHATQQKIENIVVLLT